MKGIDKMKELQDKLNEYAYKEWPDWSYIVSEDGIIEEFYADGDTGYCSVSTGRKVDIYDCSDEELDIFFNGDRKFLRIVEEELLQTEPPYDPIDEEYERLCDLR